MNNEKEIEGRVKYCNSRGFGFIGTKQQIDFYFHQSEYVNDWKELLRMFVSGGIIIVTFNNDPSGKEGPKAKNIRFKEMMEK